MIQEALKLVVRGQDLSEAEAAEAMTEILEGKATSAQIAGLAVGLRMKGENIEELTGFARVMRAKATPVPHRQGGALLDTCGTGGDGSGSFNISTTVALVAAGAGAKVAKHGNRALSSQSGSADVLAALGVKIELTPEQVGRCIDEVGIGFLFAPALHGAMKHAGPTRKELGVRTFFNLLGPLTNPAGAKRQLIGVFESDFTELLAGVLQRLGAERAWVVHGLDGLDELTLTDETRVAELKDGKVKNFFIDPSDFGFASATLSDLKGGDAAMNAGMTMAVLQGGTGARRDIVLLNAGAALLLAGLAETLKEGVELAAQAIDQGRALKTLESLKSLSQSF
jgi:anthranilate phosphoribosyltransferase